MVGSNSETDRELHFELSLQHMCVNTTSDTVPRVPPLIHALRSHFGSSAVAPTPWATMVRSWFFETALSHGPTVEMAGNWTEVAKEFNGHVMLTKGDLSMTFSDDWKVWVVEKSGGMEPIASAVEAASPSQKEPCCKHASRNVIIGVACGGNRTAHRLNDPRMVCGLTVSK